MTVTVVLYQPHASTRKRMGGRPKETQHKVGKVMKDSTAAASQRKTNTPKVENQTNLALRAQREVSGGPSGHQRRKGVMGIWGSGSHNDLSSLHT